jgi:hypothetical protein
MQIYTPSPRFDLVDIEVTWYGEPQHERDCHMADCLYGPPQHDPPVEDPDWLIAIATSAFRSGYETLQPAFGPQTESKPGVTTETKFKRVSTKARLY